MLVSVQTLRYCHIMDIGLARRSSQQTHVSEHRYMYTKTNSTLIWKKPP